MKRHIFFILLTTLIFTSGNASAFWGRDSVDSRSGLDVVAGFDVNTIKTLSGTIVTLPERQGDEQPATMTVSTPQGTMTVVLGPWWYWEKQGITFMKDQELNMVGSFAQGKDGMLYLFAQSLENRSNGEIVQFRSDVGKPLWSHSTGWKNGMQPMNKSGLRSGNRGAGMSGRGR